MLECVTGFNESAGGQVLLGLGMATLVPTAGTAVIEVGLVSGFLFGLQPQALNSASFLCFFLFLGG